MEADESAMKVFDRFCDKYDIKEFEIGIRSFDDEGYEIKKLRYHQIGEFHMKSVIESMQDMGEVQWIYPTLQWNSEFDKYYIEKEGDKWKIVSHKKARKEMERDKELSRIAEEIHKYCDKYETDGFAYKAYGKVILCDEPSQIENMWREAQRRRFEDE